MSPKNSNNNNNSFILSTTLSTLRDQSISLAQFYSQEPEITLPRPSSTALLFVTSSSTESHLSTSFSPLREQSSSPAQSSSQEQEITESNNSPMQPTIPATLQETSPLPSSTPAHPTSPVTEPEIEQTENSPGRTKKRGKNILPNEYKKKLLN